MVKNCVAKWDAHQFSAPIRLWLRNRVFYSIMELPRVNGKRRYHRISLHTTNYYEAEQKRIVSKVDELMQYCDKLVPTDN